MAQQRKQVTVLFINVDSLSAIAQQIGSSSVSNDCWHRLDQVIRQNGGQANRPISDNTIAVFGAPTAHEDDPERAVQAALEMHQALADFNDGHQLDDAIEMRIGISTGLVLYDTIGLDGGFMAIGETINVAGGLIRFMPDEPIVVDRSTYRHIRGVFDAITLPKVEIPGRERPIEAYRITQEKPRVFFINSWEIEGVEPRLVGREKEIEQLQKTMQLTLATRQARAITLSGEAGVGKSRLLDEFDTWIELIPQEIYYFKGHARPDMQSVPYGLIRDVLAFRFQIQDSDSPSQVRLKLKQGMTEFLGETGVEAAHFIGQLLGYDFSHSPYLQGVLEDSRQFRSRAFYNMLQFFLQAAVSDEGALLLLEDLQWADDDSLDLIEYLITTLRHAPFLTLATTRPTLFATRPLWGKNIPAHALLELPLLSHEAAQELVADILQKVSDLPPELPRLIAERSEGNPFYIEELVKMLIDDEVIIVSDRGWQVATERLADVRIPETLTAVLQASLDSLTDEERETMQRAAALGQVFWDEALLFMADERRLTDPEGMRQVTADTLQRLRSKGLIVRHKETSFANTEEYSFKHTMLHRATAESTLLRMRRIYHSRAAEWLIAQRGERAAEYAATIAEHYQMAENKGKTADWFNRAGHQARDAHAFRQALNYFQSALQELSDLPETNPEQWISLYGGLADMLRRQTHYQEALIYFQQMVSEAEQVGDTRAQAKGWDGIARVYDELARYQEASDAAERYYELVSASEELTEADQVAQADALSRRAWVQVRMGHIDEALSLAERSLTISNKLNARSQRAFSLNTMGTAYQVLGLFDQADKCRQDALVDYRALGNRSREAAMLSNIGEVARLQGDYQKAVSQYHRALNITEEVGDRNNQMSYLSNRGGARVGLGEFELALADLQEVIHSVGDDWFALSEAHRFMAEAYLGLGQVSKALTTIEKAMNLGHEAGDSEDMGGAWYVMGLIAETTGEPISVTIAGQPGEFEPEVCFAESLRTFTEVGMERERAWTLREWARYERNRGNEDRSQEMWQEARDIFYRRGIALQVEQMDAERPNS